MPFELIEFETLEDAVGELEIVGRGVLRHTTSGLSGELVGSGSLRGTANVDGVYLVGALPIVGQGLLATNTPLSLQPGGPPDGYGDYAEGLAAFEPLQAQASEGLYGAGAAILAPLQADGDSEGDDEQEVYAIGSMSFSYPLLSGYGSAGAAAEPVELELEALQVMGSEGAYGAGEAVLQPMGAQGFSHFEVAWSMDFTGPAHALDGIGSDYDAYLELVQPRSELTIEAGWRFPDFVQPVSELEIEAQIDVIGRFDRSEPRHRLEAHGLSGSVGAGELVQPRSRIDAALGWRFRDLVQPASQLEAQAVVGGAGQAMLNQPRSILEASGSQQLIGIFDASQPVGEFPPTGLLVLEQPRAVLVASGGEVIDTPVRAAYAINLRHYGVTGYGNYPFSRIVRFRGQYYGVGSTGMHRLEGTRDGDELIETVLETAREDFGSAYMKRVPYAYAYLNTEDAVEFTAINSEGYEGHFELSHASRDGIHTRRARLARGVKARSWGMRLRHRADGRIEIHELELIGQILSRKYG